MQVWHAYGMVPERVDVTKEEVVDASYPLRPELLESAYHLYRATNDSYWLRFGAEALISLDSHCRTECGFADVEHVLSKKLKDRMQSFFLSETMK